MEYARGTSMVTKVESETFDMPGYAIEDTSQYTGKEGVNFIDSASAWDRENGRLAVFAINRNEETEYPLTVDIKGFSGYGPAAVYTMRTDDPEARNTFGDDERIAPESVENYVFANGELTIPVKPLSWNVYLFETAKTDSEG
jgi:alpha-N-arabinofuranosidase